jgi:NADPH:quinone reductase-like Zn-dependent oxidoreductase
MAEKKTMKAVRAPAHGGPEVLNVEETPIPIPGPGEELVAVYAAGVNPADWKMLSGAFGEGPVPYTPGFDFSGVIERTGAEVFGRALGTFAERVAARATDMAPKPRTLDHVRAAAVPTAGLTAWQALFAALELVEGQTVLIHAASGGVGTFAVQLAHWRGARVIATASKEHAELVRQLGADTVIDYHAERFEERVQEVDAVVDPLGGTTQQRSWSVLKPGGALVCLVGPATVPPDASARGIRGVSMKSQTRAGDLTELAQLLDRGSLRVVLDQAFPLRDARRAFERSREGHVAGKIVLKIR